MIMTSDKYEHYSTHLIKYDMLMYYCFVLVILPQKPN